MSKVKDRSIEKIQSEEHREIFKEKLSICDLWDKIKLIYRLLESQKNKRDIME